MWTPDNIIFAGIFILAFLAVFIKTICDTVLRVIEIKSYLKLTEHPVIIAREYDEEDPDLLRDQINNLNI